MAFRADRAFRGDALRNFGGVRARHCDQHSTRRCGGLFATPAEYDLSHPARIAVDAEGGDRAAARIVDRLWYAAEDHRGIPGLLLSYCRRHDERAYRGSGVADGSYPFAVGEPAADLRQDPVSDRHATHLCRTQ